MALTRGGRVARKKPPAEVAEVVAKAPPQPKPTEPPPARPEQRIGPAMTEADILELVNGSYQ